MDRTSRPSQQHCLLWSGASAAAAAVAAAGAVAAAAAAAADATQQQQQQAALLDATGAALLASERPRGALVLGQRQQQARAVVLKRLGCADSPAPLGFLLMQLGSRLPTLDFISMVVQAGREDLNTRLAYPRRLGPYAVLGDCLTVKSVWRALSCCGFDLGEPRGPEAAASARAGRGRRRPGEGQGGGEVEGGGPLPVMLDSSMVETLLYVIAGDADTAITLLADFYNTLMSFSPGELKGTEAEKLAQVVAAYKHLKFDFGKVARWYTSRRLAGYRAPGNSLFVTRTIYIPVNTDGQHWMLIRATNSPGSSSSTEGQSSSSMEGGRRKGGSKGSNQRGGDSSSSTSGSQAAGSRGSSSSSGRWDLTAYDSLSPEVSQKAVLSTIWMWLQEEWVAASGGTMGKEPLPEGMQEQQLGSSTVCPVAKQRDGSSCGLWVLENACALAQGKQPDKATPLTQAQARVLLLVKGLVMVGKE